MAQMRGRVTLISRSGFRFLLIIVLLFLHLRPLLEQLFALYSLVFAKCSFASFLCLQLIKKTETKFILKSGKLKDRQKDHDKLHFLIYVYFYYTAFLTYRGILKVKPENPCHLGKCLKLPSSRDGIVNAVFVGIEASTAYLV